MTMGWGRIEAKEIIRKLLIHEKRKLRVVRMGKDVNKLNLGGKKSYRSSFRTSSMSSVKSEAS